MNKNIYKDLVDFLGGQTKTAKTLKIKQPSVFAWISGKSKMSAHTATLAEKLTQGKFRAVDLCPRLAEIEAMEIPSESQP